MNLWTRVRRFAAFNLVGLVTTLVGLPLMVLLELAGVSYSVYTGLNYVVGIALGFAMNFRFAFGDRRGKMGPALVRYLATFLSLLGLVLGLQTLLIEVLRWPRWTGVGVGMVVYGGLGYVLTTLWVFPAVRRLGFARRLSPGTTEGRLLRSGPRKTTEHPARGSGIRG